MSEEMSVWVFLKMRLAGFLSVEGSRLFIVYWPDHSVGLTRHQAGSMEEQLMLSRLAHMYLGEINMVSTTELSQAKQTICPL